MRAHRLTFPLMLAFALCAQRAWAFLDPPYITPTSPTSAEMIVVNIYGGECDLVDGGIVWPPPVTQQGSSLTVLFTGSHQEDLEFCYFSVGIHAFPVGSFPPGSYSLQVDWRYSTFNGWVTNTLGIIPFTVTGAPPQPVETPTLSTTSLVGLLLALIAMASLALHVRKVQLY